MRPESIGKFDLFYLAAIGIAFASGLMNYDTQLRIATGHLAGNPLQDYAGAIVLFSAAIALAFNLLIWFMASRLRMGWVKWLIVVLVLYSLVSAVIGLSMGMVSLSITGLVTVLLKAIAVSFLFRKDAAAWYRDKAGY